MINAMKKMMALLLAIVMVLLASPFAVLAEGLIEENLEEVIIDEQTETTPATSYSNTVTAASLLATGETVEPTYLEQIAALQAEAEALDPESETLQDDCADIYTRLMAVYEPAAAEYQAGTITEEEYNEIYNATGAVITILNGYGYDPNAIMTTDEVTMGQNTSITLSTDLSNNNNYYWRIVSSTDTSNAADNITVSRSGSTLTVTTENATVGTYYVQYRRYGSNTTWNTRHTITVERDAIDEGSVTVAQGGTASLTLTAAPNTSGISAEEAVAAGVTISTVEGTDGKGISVAATASATVGTYKASYTDADGEKHAFTINVISPDLGDVLVAQGLSAKLENKAANFDSKTVITIKNADGAVVDTVKATISSSGIITVTADASATMGAYDASYVGTDGVEYTFDITVVSGDEIDSIADSANEGSTDHIEIKVSATATIKLSKTETRTVEVGVDTNDTFTVTATYGGQPFTGFTRTDVGEGNGAQDGSETVAIEGTFPVGTKEKPVIYTVTLTKDVSIDLDGDTSTTDDVITTPVTFTVTMGYWDEDNDCPGLFDNGVVKTDWVNGEFITINGTKSGIDIDVSGELDIGTQITTGKLAIQKTLTDSDTAEAFEFSIRQRDGDMLYLVFDSDGKCIGTSATPVYVTVTSGTSLALSEIPEGYYIITEKQEEGYTITDANGNASDNYSKDYTVQYKDDEELPVVEFTNKKLSSNESAMSISKKATGAEFAADAVVSVSIYAADANGQATGTAVWTGDVPVNGAAIYPNATLTAGTTYVVVESGYVKDGYTCTISMEVDGEAASAVTGTDGNAVLGSFTFIAEASTRHDLILTNTYAEIPQTTSVTIEKQVDGNMGDLNKSFGFTAYVYDSSSDVVKTVTSAQNGVTIDAETGKISFSLADNGNVSISGVPIGGYIVVTEESTGYVTTVSGATLTEESPVNTYAEATSGALTADGLTIIFTNTNEAEVDTGILLDSLPYVLILAVVGAAVVLWFIRKRRVED